MEDNNQLEYRKYSKQEQQFSTRPLFMSLLGSLLQF